MKMNHLLIKRVFIGTFALSFIIGCGFMEEKRNINVQSSNQESKAEPGSFNLVISEQWFVTGASFKITLINTVDSNKITQTFTQGDILIKNVPVGRYSLLIEYFINANLIQSGSNTVEIFSQKTTTVDITLSNLPPGELLINVKGTPPATATTSPVPTKTPSPKPTASPSPSATPLSCAQSNTCSAKFAWDNVTQNTDGSSLNSQVQYIIKYGKSSGNYTSSIDAGSNTSFTITKLGSGTYYFAVFAVVNGVTSSPSNELVKNF